MSEIDKLCAAFGLRGQEGRFLSIVLNARDVARKADVYAAIRVSMASEDYSKLTDVVACRTRKKLSAALNTKVCLIETVTGRGYRISESDKALIRERAGLTQTMERAA